MTKDINDAKQSSKTVMSSEGVTRAIYNLGLSKNAGTMSTMFKTDKS